MKTGVFLGNDTRMPGECRGIWVAEDMEARLQQHYGWELPEGSEDLAALKKKNFKTYRQVGPARRLMHNACSVADAFLTWFSQSRNPSWLLEFSGSFHVCSWSCGPARSALAMRLRRSRRKLLISGPVCWLCTREAASTSTVSPCIAPLLVLQHHVTSVWLLDLVLSCGLHQGSRA